MIRIVLMIVLATAHAVGAQRPCTCDRAPESETIRWGNDNVVLAKAARVRELRGTVTTSGGEAMAAALVEVFTDPAVMTQPYSPERERRRRKQRRVA